MNKLFLLLLLVAFPAAIVHSQTIYELSFNLQHTSGEIPAKAFFLDNNDGKGKLRVRFIDPVRKDSILAELDAAEEFTDAACAEDKLWYKLDKLNYIDTRDPGIPLPAFLNFKKDVSSGLFEPSGFSGSKDCNAAITKFTNISLIEKKDLTQEFVLSWFRQYDLFYRNLFVTNNPRALTVAERNIKLYLLIVANVTDAKIGTADRKNMNDAIAFFSKVKETLGIDQFLYDTVAGAALYSKETVERKIKTFLAPGPNDIVVFYYSGHGYRKPKDGRPGPYIDLRVDYNKSYLLNSLSMEDIKDSIKKKGARFNLLLSDCCNAFVTDTNPMVQDQAISGKKGGFDLEWSVQNCRDLFLSTTPTTIFATAAEPHQLAISNPVFGGFFSNYFMANTASSLGYSKRNVNWTDIFEQVKSQTEKKTSRTWCNDARTVKCGRQRPYVNIQYGRF